MPKATCEINLTLEPSVAEHVEQIARGIYERPTGVGRKLLVERLALESAGWKIGDEGFGRLLEAVCRLSKESVMELSEVIRRLGTV